MEKIHNIDLTRLTQIPPACVVCHTKEESEILIGAMYDQLPEYTRAWGGRDVLNRSNYGDRTAYTLFGNVKSTSPERLMYGRVGWFNDHHYEILTVCDLLCIEIPEIEASIDNLLFYEESGE